MILFGTGPAIAAPHGLRRGDVQDSAPAFHGIPRAVSPLLASSFRDAGFRTSVQPSRSTACPSRRQAWA